jgi:uncharacterized repeat protein (TIGR01451 family)
MLSNAEFRLTSHGRPALILALLAGAAALPTVAQATGTRAGTLIDNTATATYQQGGSPVVVPSNIVTLRVDELIDTVVDWRDPSNVSTTPGATGQVLSYQVTNTGNGVETFGLTTANAGGDQFDPTVTSIVIDDGDGVYEPGIDVVYVPGSNDPTLNPDASVTVFVVSTTPGTVTDGNLGNVQLVATSRTGTGTPGTSFAGAGEGGGDAIIGTSGGDGSDLGTYEVTSATVALVKSAVVTNQFGNDDPVPGATITYTIVATVTGSGSLTGLSIADAIPAGTTYVPNSITLGGTAQTDATDADASSFAASAIAVSLGTVPGGQTRTVTFRVTIN